VPPTGRTSGAALLFFFPFSVFCFAAFDLVFGRGAPSAKLIGFRFSVTNTSLLFFGPPGGQRVFLLVENCIPSVLGFLPLFFSYSNALRSFFDPTRAPVPVSDNSVAQLSFRLGPPAWQARRFFCSPPLFAPTRSPVSGAPFFTGPFSGPALLRGHARRLLAPWLAPPFLPHRLNAIRVFVFSTARNKRLFPYGPPPPRFSYTPLRWWPTCPPYLFFLLIRWCFVDFFRTQGFAFEGVSFLSISFPDLFFLRVVGKVQGGKAIVFASYTPSTHPFFFCYERFSFECLFK